MHYTEIESESELEHLLNSKQIISKYAFQHIDFTAFSSALSEKKFTDCIFLGCTIPNNIVCNLQAENYLFPKLNLPYNSYINKLYTKDVLYKNYILNKPDSYKQTLDYKVYEHFIATGKEAWDIKETLGRRLHDHSVTDALYDFLDNYADDKKVAIMAVTAFLELTKVMKPLL